MSAPFTLSGGFLSFTPRLNVDGAIAASSRFIELMSDMQIGPMAKANLDGSDVYQQAMRDRFDSYSLGGGDWTPLAPSTIRRKRNSSGANLILVENGDMRASLNRGDGNHFVQPTRDGLREGSMDRKIAFHNSGTSRMPRREVYTLPDGTVVTRMASIGAVGVVESAREAGFQAA